MPNLVNKAVIVVYPNKSTRYCNNNVFFNLKLDSRIRLLQHNKDGICWDDELNYYIAAEILDEDNCLTVWLDEDIKHGTQE